MSIGGFTAVVEVTEIRVSGGFGDGGQVFNEARMKLNGKLSDLHYGDFRGPIAKHITAWVNIVIHFMESQERLDLEDTDKAYIGDIRLDVSENAIRADVNIALPIAVFEQISVFGDKKIRFDTVHDIIASPSEREKADHVVAYVKRAYFEYFYWRGK